MNPFEKVWASEDESMNCVGNAPGKDLNKEQESKSAGRWIKSKNFTSEALRDLRKASLPEIADNDTGSCKVVSGMFEGPVADVEEYDGTPVCSESTGTFKKYEPECEMNEKSSPPEDSCVMHNCSLEETSPPKVSLARRRELMNLAQAMVEIIGQKCQEHEHRYMYNYIKILFLDYDVKDYSSDVS